MRRPPTPAEVDAELLSDQEYIATLLAQAEEFGTEELTEQEFNLFVKVREVQA